MRALKTRLEAQALGDVLSLLARRVGLMPPRVHDANVILDLAIHDVDVFRYLLGAGEPDDVFCNAGKAVNGDLFDYADVFLRFGKVGCLLQANWMTPVKIRSLSATGTRGYADLEYIQQELDVYPAAHPVAAQSFAQLTRYSEVEPERIAVEHTEPLRPRATMVPCAPPPADRARSCPARRGRHRWRSSRRSSPRWSASDGPARLDPDPLPRLRPLPPRGDRERAGAELRARGGGRLGRRLDRRHARSGRALPRGRAREPRERRPRADVQPRRHRGARRVVLLPLRRRPVRAELRGGAARVGLRPKARHSRTATPRSSARSRASSVPSPSTRSLSRT